MSTILVDGNYVVPAGSDLTFDGSSPAYTLDGYNTYLHPGTPDPNFTDLGSITVSSSTADADLEAITDNEGGFYQFSLIKIAAGGSLTVDATGAGSSAYGYHSGGWPAAVENDGVWTISAVDTAAGVTLQQGYFNGFTNTGVFSVTASHAIGVDFSYSGPFSNSGSITVSGHASAVGLELGYAAAAWGIISNSGTITATADPGNSSIGIDLTGAYLAPLIIDNGGTITATTAIRIYIAVTPPESAIVDLTNSGTINGEIDLSQGPPAGATTGSQIVNTGAIHGAIHLNTNGDSLYSGAGGTQTGGIYLGEGTDTVMLGNDGETVHGSSGAATVTSGAGNDTIIGGSGTTTVSYASATSGVTVDLSLTSAQNTGGGGTDTLQNVQSLVGSDYNDVFAPGSGNESFDGGGGVNTLVLRGDYATYTVTQTSTGYTVQGSGGTDTLTSMEILQFADRQMVIGSAGETLTARPGGDTLVGGAGNDTLVAGTGTDTLDGGAGVNTAVLGGDYAAHSVTQTDSGYAVQGSGGTASLANIEVLQFADRQMVLGSAGQTLTARSGGDTLIGGGGNDTFDIGSGPDVVDGGAGFNTAVFSGTYSSYHVGPSGSATTVTGPAGTANLTNVELLVFHDAQQALGSSAQTLTARSGGDTLIGGAGDDTFKIGSGHDVVEGGDGSNTAAFSGRYSSYTISHSGATTTVTGANGTATLTDIQALQFADKTVLLGDHAVAELADFTGAGQSGILWQDTAGDVSTWNVTGSTTLTMQPDATYDSAPGNGWQLTGTMDFTGDGRSDVFWHNSSTGQFALWHENSSGVFSTEYVSVPVDASYSIGALGDFSGDGKDDMLWRKADGTVTEWQSTGSGFNLNTFSDTVSTAWHIQGVGDFNGDGAQDVLWRNGDGSLSVWSGTSSGFQENTYSHGAVATSWHVAGIGDFNADGKADILWWNDSGAVSLWTSTGSGFTENTYYNTVGSGWSIAGVYDFNGDGKADILWHNSNGQISIWESTGSGFSSVYTGSAPTNWAPFAMHYDIV